MLSKRVLRPYFWNFTVYIMKRITLDLQTPPNYCQKAMSLNKSQHFHILAADYNLVQLVAPKMLLMVIPKRKMVQTLYMWRKISINKVRYCWRQLTKVYVFSNRWSFKCDDHTYNIKTCKSLDFEVLIQISLLNINYPKKYSCGRPMRYELGMVVFMRHINNEITNLFNQNFKFAYFEKCFWESIYFWSIN